MSWDWGGWEGGREGGKKGGRDGGREGGKGMVRPLYRGDFGPKLSDGIHIPPVMSSTAGS